MTVASKMSSEEPMSSLDEAPSTLALVTMLSRSIYRTTAEHDGSMSMNLKHVIALSYLRELGAVGQKYFGGVLCLDANNTVLLLNELEAGGLVVRRRDAEDRRRHVVEVTEVGLDVLRQIEAGMLDIEDELLAALSDEQRAQFRELLHQALYGEHGVLRRLAAGVV
jgi:MarR family transcriptional regulator, lower aerobic nicotinate degradation pathway regulator